MLAPAFLASGGHACRRVKARRLALYPFDERRDFGVGLEALDICETSRQLGFRKPGVNGAVANLVQAHGAQMRPALEARRQVMAARFCIGRNRSITDWADIRRASGCGS